MAVGKECVTVSMWFKKMLCGVGLQGSSGGGNSDPFKPLLG